MTAKQSNPEKWMLFLFPLITLSLFIFAILVMYFAPRFFNMGQ